MMKKNSFSWLAPSKRNVILGDLFVFFVGAAWLIFLFAINIATKEGYMSQTMFDFCSMGALAIAIFFGSLLIYFPDKIYKSAEKEADESCKAAFKSSRKSK